MANGQVSDDPEAHEQGPVNLGVDLLGPCITPDGTRTFRDDLEAEISLENHNFALYWSLPPYKT
jgi:hypothetical protein